MGQARERDPASTSYVGKAAAGIRSRALARRRTLRAMRIRRASGRGGALRQKAILRT
jgi:hypothetical protein